MLATAARLYGNAKIDPHNLEWEWSTTIVMPSGAASGKSGVCRIRVDALDALSYAILDPQIAGHLWNSEVKALNDLINVQWRGLHQTMKDIRFEITPFNHLCSTLNFESRGGMIGHPWLPTYPNFMFCYDVNNQGPGSFPVSNQIPIVQRSSPSDDPDVDLLDFITI